MGRVYWPAGPLGRYWIDISLGGIPERVLIDLGLIDPKHEIGFVVAPAIYHRLKQSRQLSRFRDSYSRTAGGQRLRSEAGQGIAQLVDPVTRLGVGPAVQVYVGRGVSGVHSRVGVAFFHKLVGCRVVWELDQRTWCVEYP